MSTSVREFVTGSASELEVEGAGIIGRVVSGA